MESMKIMIVEDNASMRMGLVESLRREGFEVHAFSDGESALKFFKQKPLPLVITDLKMDGMSGMDVLEQVKTIQPQTAVMVVSAFGTVDTAVHAMRKGAADFLTKPFSPEELRFRVGRLVEKIRQEIILTRLKEENELLQGELLRSYGAMIGTSQGIKKIFNLIDRVALEDSTILIEGESGTGKELVARAIHQKSNRHDKPFVKVNCGALSENLLESELFGHEKGAFTGAIKRKKGRFELADGGTLFLDEIGDISQAMQVRLLRVMQEREFERVGGEDTIAVNVRIIAATHRSLSKMVQEEKFREDLFYRLRVIPISLPPLRERQEDIPLLVHHFLNQYAGTRGQSSKQISDEAMETLKKHTWPGNIRELQNLIERLCVISENEIIDDAMINQHITGPSKSLMSGFENLPLEQALEAFEKGIIMAALKKSNNIKNQAAKLLGIPTSSLYYKMEKFQLL